MQVVDNFVAKPRHEGAAFPADGSHGTIQWVADDSLVAGAVHRGRIHFSLAKSRVGRLQSGGVFMRVSAQ